MGYIYQILNKKNNKCYIGQSSRSDINERWKEHKQKKKGCPMLKNAIKSYGLDNFEFKIIIICFDSDLNYYEEYYIKKYNSLSPNGYNLLEGGGQINLTKYNCKKVYQYNLDGKFINEFSSVTEAANKLGLKIDSISNSIRSNRSKTYAGFIWKYEKIDPTDDEKTIKSYKKIYQYDKNGKFLNEYKNIAEASRKNDIYCTNLSRCAHGYQDFAGDYMWSFLKLERIPRKDEIKRTSKRKMIIQFSMDGKFIKEYESIMDASRETKIPKSTISLCFKKDKKAGGFLWEIKN